MHIVLTFLNATLLAAGLYAAVNLVLWLAWMGNPCHVAFAWSVRRIATAVPPGTTFTSNGKVVSVIVYDPGEDEESIRLAYASPASSFLTWTGGPRSAARIARAAKNEIILKIFFFAILFIPVTAFGAWLAISVNWTWTFAFLFFLELQAISAYAGAFGCLRYGFFYGLVAAISLHEFSWIHMPPWTYFLISGIVCALQLLWVFYMIRSGGPACRCRKICHLVRSGNLYEPAARCKGKIKLR